MYALYTIDTAILCVAAILALRLQIIVNPPLSTSTRCATRYMLFVASK